MDDTKKQLGGNELAAAFGGAKPAKDAEKVKTKKPQGSAKKKKVVSLTVMIIGLIALVGGVVFLVINLMSKPAVPDGEYLMSATEWTLKDGSNCANTEPEANCAGESRVIWKFTEVGKGTLTTNNHQNDYDFIWALEDENTLKIETKWLYNLENEYQYELDKNTGVLTLTAGDAEYVFTAQFANDSAN